MGWVRQAQLLHAAARLFPHMEDATKRLTGQNADIDIAIVLCQM